MEYEKRIRCLENYRVRTISNDIISIDEKGKKTVDTSSSKYFYGKIPDYKIDKDFNYILDSDGEKIPNTININIFLRQKLDDIAIYTDTIFSNGEGLSGPPLLSCPTSFILEGETEDYLGEFLMGEGNIEVVEECCVGYADQILGYAVYWDGQFCRPQTHVPGGGDDPCMGDLQMTRDGETGIDYILLNGEPISQQCCGYDVTGFPVFWNGQYCEIRGER